MGTIQTRIKLKYDTLTNWNTSNPVLLKGELALVDPGLSASDGSKTIMMKVGDGTKKFSELDWAWAKASDVYGWAKKDVPPSIEISGGGVAADEYVTGISSAKYDSTNHKIVLTVTKAKVTIPSGTGSVTGTGPTDTTNVAAGTTTQVIYPVKSVSLTGHTLSGSKYDDAVYTAATVEKRLAEVKAGASSYLGTVTSAETLKAKEGTAKNGDFVRVSTAFGSYHASDLLIWNGSSWDVVHGETDTNNWMKNTINSDGYVTAPGATGGIRFWRTDANGNPSWQTLNAASASQIGGVKLGSDTVQTVAAAAVTATSGRTYAVQVNSSGQMVVNVPWVDTNDNTHYTSKNIVSNGASATANGAATNGNVYLNHLEESKVTSSHKIIGSGLTSVTSDASGNITINTTYTPPTHYSLKVNAGDVNVATYDTSAEKSVNLKASGAVKITGDSTGTVTFHVDEAAAVNNGALKDRTGATFFSANTSQDFTLETIDCGSASTVI